MNNKKPTDSEIVKALECCIGDTDGKDCFGCPLYEIDDCQAHLNLAALDLINRQKAEIERLREEKSKLENKIDEIYPLVMQLPNAMQQAKAEAYKEFAERLKDMHKHNTTSVVSLVTVFDNINNLVKEMVGENNA